MSLGNAEVSMETERMTAASVARALRDLSMLKGTAAAGKKLRDQIVEHARQFFGADAVAMWRLRVARTHVADRGGHGLVHRLLDLHDRSTGERECRVDAPRAAAHRGCAGVAGRRRPP